MLVDQPNENSPAQLLDRTEAESTLTRRFGRNLRRMGRKPLVSILTASREQPKPPDRTKDVRISMVAVGFATAAIVVPAAGLVTVPLLLYSARGVLRHGTSAFFKGQPNTASMVAIVIFASLFTQFWLFAAVSAVVAQYSYIVSDRVRNSARSSMVDIFKQRPNTVWIPQGDDTEVEVPIDSVQVGDTVIVHTGEIVPIDGTLVAGFASVDQHILTGEAQPAEKEVGDVIYASTVVVSGKAYVRVEQTGDATTVAKIGNILSQTLDYRSQRELKAEDWANSTVTPTLLFSVATLPVLGVTGSLAVVNAHYKRRMSMAGPISILNYFRILSDQGILVKDGRTLDAIVDVDTVVFDKTGTLTIAQPTVGSIHSYADADVNTILSLAATAEDKQTHPIALAILDAARERGLHIQRADDTAYKVGYGLTVQVAGHTVRVGSLRFMESEALNIPTQLYEQQGESHALGHSLVVVARDAHVIGAIELVPTVRPEAAAVVDWLRGWGIQETYIISGDHEKPTSRLAAELGIDHYFAEVLPQDKAAIIEALQAQGRTVCYVGDGINDSIALKKAAVSVSLTGASDVAVDTAQVILLHEDLQALPALFAYGREYDQNLRNLFRYTALAPMLISLAFLPIPVLNLYVSLVATIFSLSGSVAYAMLPIWRYQLRQRRTTQYLPGQQQAALPAPDA